VLAHVRSTHSTEPGDFLWHGKCVHITITFFYQVDEVLLWHSSVDKTYFKKNEMRSWFIYVVFYGTMYM